MIQQWKYLDNQFITATRTSYKKAVQLSIYHDADLEVKKATEPLLIPIYDRYHLLHLTLVNEYNTWKSAGGSQQGETLNLTQMLDLAYSKMPLWDLTIQSAGPTFMKGTPTYKALFMDGKSPFITGSIDNRINAYDTLAKNMLPFAPLAATMAQVAAVYKTLDTARNAQLGAKGGVKSGSGKVEDARKAAMTMQWRNLGFAMDMFWDKPMFIESMFDLQTLRESNQRIFTGTLDLAENEAVLIHTFLSDDQLRLKNNGNAGINFYLGTKANATDSDAIKVTANTEVVIAASDFGALDFGTHRFLTAVNQSATETTKYEVEVI